MGKKGVEEMIEQIEIFIDNCKYQPLSQNKIVVHKDELESMINELKLKLPSEIERCKKIMRNKEAILADARTRSDAIITESVNEANRLVDQHQITELANVRANEILEMARNQAQQIVDQAAEEANEVRLGAMYYTKDKLSEMRDIFNKIHDIEKENYRTLIESLENDSYVVETNLSEMEANINLLAASTNKAYSTQDDDLDSAFAEPPAANPQKAARNQPVAEDEDDDYDDDIDVYGEDEDDEDFVDDDDFLDD
ncbi:MAG: hypothetical protein K2H07_07255 [Lachnospiraceae bacterium]|nr:hypothetical protein [Lachnospiraceae bacterium]